MLLASDVKCNCPHYNYGEVTLEDCEVCLHYLRCDMVADMLDRLSEMKNPLLESRYGSCP